MKTQQIGEELTIQETPGCLWIFASLFLIIGGVFVYGSLGGFTNYKDFSLWVIALTFLMGAAGVAVGIWIIFKAPLTKVIIDRSAQTLTHQTVGLIGKREIIYTFEQVRRFCLVENKDSDGDSIWSLGFEITGGKVIEISKLPSHSEQLKRDFVFQINDFMNKQFLPSQILFEPADESKNKLS